MKYKYKLKDGCSEKAFLKTKIVIIKIFCCFNLSLMFVKYILVH
jgi:hypothetical protein